MVPNETERRITIGDFLTPEEIKQAQELYNNTGIKTFAAACKAQIIEPNIKKINAKIGQECDPLFLAYAVEYAILMAEKHGRKL